MEILALCRYWLCCCILHSTCYSEPLGLGFLFDGIFASYRRALIFPRRDRAFFVFQILADGQVMILDALARDIKDV